VLRLGLATLPRFDRSAPPAVPPSARWDGHPTDPARATDATAVWKGLVVATAIATQGIRTQARQLSSAQRWAVLGDVAAVAEVLAVTRSDLLTQTRAAGRSGGKARRAAAALAVDAREVARLAGDPALAERRAWMPPRPGRGVVPVGALEAVPAAVVNMGRLLARGDASITDVLAVTRVLAQTSRAAAAALNVAGTSDPTMATTLLSEHADVLARAATSERANLASLVPGSALVLAQGRELGAAHTEERCTAEEEDDGLHPRHPVHSPQVRHHTGELRVERGHVADEVPIGPHQSSLLDGLLHRRGGIPAGEVLGQHGPTDSLTGREGPQDRATGVADDIPLDEPRAVPGRERGTNPGHRMRLPGLAPDRHGEPASVECRIRRRRPADEAGSDLQRGPLVLPADQSRVVVAMVRLEHHSAHGAARRPLTEVTGRLRLHVVEAPPRSAGVHDRAGRGASVPAEPAPSRPRPRRDRVQDRVQDPPNMRSGPCRSTPSKTLTCTNTVGLTGFEPATP
jgi:hypothetical protein